MSRICKDIEQCLKRCKELLTQPETDNLVLASACTALTAVLSVSGDTIFDATIRVTRSSGQNFSVYIREGYGTPFKLQQIQDCWNNICCALSVCEEASFHTLWTFLQGALNSLLNPSLNRAVPGFERSNPRVSQTLHKLLTRMISKFHEVDLIFLRLLNLGTIVSWPDIRELWPWRRYF